MNKYRVETTGEIYGKSIMCVTAHTPFDATEKAVRHMGWRQKEDVIYQHVIILDGSKQTWYFEK